MIIRNFQPTDTFSVIKLASITLSEYYNPSLFSYFYETYPEGFLVAELNHKIVGFLVGVHINTQLSKILMISVSPDFHKKKIGTQLLQKFIEISKKDKIKRIELEVRTDNFKAINFYLKNKFKITEKIEGFYQNGEDAYSMHLDT